MRSRYSAFVQLNSSYILNTWHRRTRPTSIEFNAHQKWLGLRIVDARIHDDGVAQVEFVARFRIGGSSASKLHERSRFVREGERWFYLDGVILNDQGNGARKRGQV
jgi:SEC-C motif-containing protein